MNEAFAFSSDYMPRILALPSRVRFLRGGEQGNRGYRGGGRLEFREHRDYVPGDDPRDIDWNVVLRSGVLAVKQYTREELPEVLVILDRSASMGSDDRDKDRICREFAGGLASVCLATGATFTIAILAEGGPVTLASVRSVRKLEQVIRVLEGLGTPSGPTHLEPLRHLKPTTGRGRVSFLISDFLVDPIPTKSLLTVRRGTGRACLVHVLTSAERHPELRSGMRLKDPESGRDMTFPGGGDVMGRYLRELAHHEDRVAQLAAAHGLQRAGLSDGQGFESAVLGCFQTELVS